MDNPKFGWQVQAGWGSSRTDYGEEETQLLEAAWTRQMWSTAEIAITLHGLPGWEDHVFYLGDRLQQVNMVTGTSRTMRRLVVVQQGLPGTTSTR